jgi:Neurotransmitter-gated ion-channel ligand binding domain
MELLISLELEWYDDRLSWEPFLGGCQRASFRASLDSEQTEIWVPHLELVNMAETGSNTLPEASASVMYDGRVLWRRTGVLSVTCQLTGVENFPFDSAGYVDE